MKEIDINIEGYNVNGICVGCLNYDRKMFYCDSVKECFRILGEIDTPDGLNIQVCWECLAAVQKVMSFREQIAKSYDILIDYSRQQIFLNSPEDLTTHATTKLSISHVDTTEILKVDTKSENGIRTDEPNEDSKETVFLETDKCDNYSNLDDNLNGDLKIEDNINFGIDKVKDEYENQNLDDFHTEYEDDNCNKYEDDSSNEDMRLSELQKRKIKKEKKKDKKKKKDPEKPSRKLLNVPQDIIELYTMTEEEMWKIRSDDVASVEFAKLKYKCSDCVISFNSQKLMDYHMNGKHNPKGDTSYPCDVCKSYLLTKESVTAHRLKHLSAYKCKICNRISTIKSVMTNHACAKISDNYQCSLCTKTFSTKAKLNYHKNVCSQERPQCDCCGKLFANKLTLKYHLKVLPQNKEEKPKEKLYIPCKGCNKVFNSKKSYRAHVVIHDGIKYPCPDCGKLFQWKRNLSRHARVHAERARGAAHCCAPCGKTFSSRDCLANHLRLSKRHVPPETLAHECSYCGKKFASKWCLVDHIDWDHLKKIKYQCSVCFKAFKTAKIMVAHKNNIHGGKSREDESEHLCDICGKSYKTVKRLKGHVWAMHTQRSSGKGYKCKLCSATFTWQTSIYKHMKIMHDEGKRSKGRTVQSTAKKQEPFTEIELANRMQYFHQNLTSNITPAQIHQTLSTVPNVII